MKADESYHLSPSPSSSEVCRPAFVYWQTVVIAKMDLMFSAAIATDVAMVLLGCPWGCYGHIFSCALLCMPHQTEKLLLPRYSQYAGQMHPLTSSRLSCTVELNTYTRISPLVFELPRTTQDAFLVVGMRAMCVCV